MQIKEEKININSIKERGGKSIGKHIADKYRNN